MLEDEFVQILVDIGETLREYDWSIEGGNHIPTNPDGHFVTVLKEHLAFLLDENIIKLLLNAKADAMMAEAVALKKIAQPDWLDGEEEN